jgi:hypothetical protein
LYNEDEINQAAELLDTVKLVSSEFEEIADLFLDDIANINYSGFFFIFNFYFLF